MIITDKHQKNLGFYNLEQITIPSLSPSTWFIWSNTVLPRIIKRCKIDIYHSFKHVTAYYLKTNKVLTFHGGAMLYKFPEFYKWYDLLYWKLSYRSAIKLYDRIIVAAAEEQAFFMRHFAIPESKFRIVNLAADKRFRVVNDEYFLNKIRNKYNLPERFILFVGQIHPQKNIERLIIGYMKSRDKLREHYKLVICGGGSGEYFSKISKLLTKLDITKDILFLGRVSQDDLVGVYNLADVFLFPSNYESFGIVILEAMACGLPIITSDIPDIDDVVKDNACRVNPENIDDIAQAIVKVIELEELRKSLQSKSLIHANRFSWKRCAVETLKVYEELIEN